VNGTTYIFRQQPCYFSRQSKQVLFLKTYAAIKPRKVHVDLRNAEQCAPQSRFIVKKSQNKLDNVW